MTPTQRKAMHDAIEYINPEHFLLAVEEIELAEKVVEQLRSALAKPAPEPRPVTPYSCPKCHALWLHWPAEQTGFGQDTLNCRSATHCDQCEKGGVEQLERLERIPANLKTSVLEPVQEPARKQQDIVNVAELPPPTSDDPDEWVRFWLDSALRCPSFVWDADQRDIAETYLEYAVNKRATAQVREPVPLLTDNEIRKSAYKADEGGESAEYLLSLARAIEQAVRQKAGL